jgi:hypothetical protein
MKSPDLLLTHQVCATEHKQTTRAGYFIRAYTHKKICISIQNAGFYYFPVAQRISETDKFHHPKTDSTLGSNHQEGLKCSVQHENIQTGSFMKSQSVLSVKSMLRNVSFTLLQLLCTILCYKLHEANFKMLRLSTYTNETNF